MEFHFLDRFQHMAPPAGGDVLKMASAPGVIPFSAGNPSAETFPLKEMEQVIQTIEQTKEYIKKVLDATLECRESVSRKRYSDLLKEAVSYIEHHYEEEDISLNQVAASVNISPSHFSTIFSKEMGETFIEYLTNVRMERAKQLLRSSTMKTAEIAYAVGYKDAHYFSYLFKKVQKCTPREFRTQV